MLTTLNEVDILYCGTNMMKLWSEYKDAFAEKHGVKLDLMSGFVKVILLAHRRDLWVQLSGVPVDEMAGGTFTISNGGVYMNPPQSGILGMHSIVCPVVQWWLMVTLSPDQ
ncbi:hypothetical protein OPV22_022400 [Ensete ventricosum]|uniref:Uncharacterized protein n=1 Tax=Ensete ventricosum TaxID=4639 RepID=A0AAV8QPT4_ENSVE|nr:hypothetical protein OPV22_022400 [Ensete ventricosum]